MTRQALLVLLTLAACVPVRPPAVTPPVTSPATMIVHVEVYDDVAHAKISGAVIRYWYTGATSADAIVQTSDAVGNTAFIVPATVRASHMWASAEGFLDADQHVDAAPNTIVAFRLARKPPPDVDPSTIPVEKLMDFRGSLFTVKAGSCVLPYGPRPGQPDNIAWFGAWYYSLAQQQCVQQLWRDHTYTHGVMGPLVAAGYHGQQPDADFRSTPEAWEDLMQDQWNAGLYPVVVLVPDHWGADKSFGEHVWTVAELRDSLEPIYRRPRFQTLARIVMLCWECQGDKYGWSNRKHVEYLTWMAEVFPHAIRVLHSPVGFEAPAGEGDELDLAKCGARTPGVDCFNGTGGAWKTVAPLIHAWFEQDNELYEQPQFVDPNPRNGGRTRAQNWDGKWDRTNPNSFVSRFAHGAGGWPTTSANPPSINGGHVCAVAAEFLSYPVWWQNYPEDMARDAGARAKVLGACGVMDGIK